MTKFFEVFGKVSAVLIVLGVLVYGGYYFGVKNSGSKTASTTATPVKNTENTNGVQKTATPTSQKLTILNAGVSKSAGLSFDQYSIAINSDWVSKKESQTTLDEKLILEKDNSSISIFQAATGGALCLYPGDAEFEGPSSKYELFVEITTQDGRILRRSGEKNGTAFTVCQKAADGSFQQPTNYGHISVKLDANFSPEILTEIDSMIASLKKI